MAKHLDLRIEKLEKELADMRGQPPFLICRSTQTREQAEAEYEKKHGFKLQEHARVIQIVRVDAKQARAPISMD